MEAPSPSVPAASRLEAQLAEVVRGADACVGVGVIIDGTDTVALAGRRPFPMLSVYKFPIAMAVAAECRRRGEDFGATCLVWPERWRRDTWSPMLALYADATAGGVAVTLRELLRYALQQSDNNASDVLLAYAGGAARVQHYLDSLGMTGIAVRWSEEEMYQDTARCRDNVATPLAMARLADHFDRHCRDALSLELKEMLEHCATGTDRLARPLTDAGAVVGHKTGTGFTTFSGRIMAVNDAGYVHLASGRRYAIAVFLEDAAGGMDASAALIARISALVRDHVESRGAAPGR